MSNRLVRNINDYTIIEECNPTKIYFYPAHAFTKTKISSKDNDFCVEFNIEPISQKIYKLYCSLIDENGTILYKTYGINLQELSSNKFEVLSPYKWSQDKEIIDFNTFDYDTFIDVMKNNKQLAKMIPALSEAIKKLLNEF